MAYAYAYILITLATSLLASHSANGAGICEDPSVCCRGASTPEIKGNPGDCTGFYLCINSHPRRYQCPNPERPFYNAASMSCDVPEGVPTCLTTPIAIMRPAPVRQDQTMTNRDPRPHPRANINTNTNADANCTESGVYYVPYPGDCRRYMICVNHDLRPEPQQCGDGLLFDPEEGNCLPAAEVPCQPTCPEIGNAFFPDQNDCASFWFCNDGEISHATCDEDFLFDPVSLLCKKEDTIFCPNICPLEGIDRLPNERSSDCDLFWLCIDGEANLQRCGTGMIFDKDVKDCVSGVCPSVRFLNR